MEFVLDALTKNGEKKQMNKREKEQVEREIDRQCEKVSKTVSGYWILAIVVGLFKVYRFKETRIIKVLKTIIKEVDILTCGMIGMTDYKNSLKEEYDIDIEKIMAEIRGKDDE